MTPSTPDVLIVGAGPAGLTAALVLARAGRAVVVLDGGPGRNAPADHSYNVFTRDSAPPAELRRLGREQAEGYGAQFVEAEATHADVDAEGVRVRLAPRLRGGRLGHTLAARRLLLASGVEDVLPEIPGVREAWGATVVHCPYCHGHELRGRPTAVLATNERSAELAGFLLGWTDRVTLLTDGAGLDAESRAGLEAQGIAVDDRPVAALDVSGRAVRAVVFADGARLDATAVYVQPPQRPRGLLPDALGLALTEAGHVRADEVGRTSAPNVWACGDLTTPMQAVQMAASAGFAAAAFLNHDLVAEGGARYAP